MTDNKKRVLIVEDDSRILKMLRLRLEIDSYEVIAAQDGEGAMRLVESKRPDILLLDLLLPVMNGFEVLEKLRVSSRLPVVAMSANRDLGEKALRLGANVFISKPFDPDKLASKVKELLK